MQSPILRIGNYCISKTYKSFNKKTTKFILDVHTKPINIYIIIYIFQLQLMFFVFFCFFFKSLNFARGRSYWFGPCWLVCWLVNVIFLALESISRVKFESDQSTRKHSLLIEKYFHLCLTQLDHPSRPHREKTCCRNVNSATNQRAAGQFTEISIFNCYQKISS